MITSKYLPLFLAVFVISVSSAYSQPQANTHAVDNSVPLEENPNYVPYESEDGGTDEDDTDDDSEDEYDDESDEEYNLKSVVNKALAKSNKLPSKALKFVKKNRTEITIVCALFAFRREIWQVVVAAATVPNKDGSRNVRVKFSPTAILKIALFIDVVRKIQHGQVGGEDSERSSLSGRMGLVGLLADIMKPENSAFIPPVVQHYTFEKMNDRYLKDRNAFRKAMGMEIIRPNPSGIAKPFMNRGTYTDTPSLQYNSTTIIMEMKGLDSGLSSMESIRDQVSFLLDQNAILRKESMILDNIPIIDVSEMASNESINVTSKEDGGDQATDNVTSKEDDGADMEIVILLESPGGSASDYGLAAQQIGRLRDEPGIKVTICVDTVAASGGYMIACMSSPDSLFAAPFAIVGSIGVIGQTINIHKSLENWGVQPLVFRGGKDKAPVGLVGEVTKEGLAKVQDMVDKTHSAFKRHVANARPQMAETIDQIATGDVWLASDAVEIGMVDGILTSDEYIRGKIVNGGRVLKLVKCQRPRFGFGPHPQFGGVFHQTLRSVSDTIRDFGSILKKANALLEDQQSQVVSARAIGVGSVSSAWGKR